MAVRNLSLTEELEKLEQSITLTLQEIDHNFSKAHRIVTTSILPVVEQYGEHSRSVWEASKFWKHFFEASANVSLSGYEDLADENAEGDETATTANEDTTVHEDDEDVTVGGGQFTPQRERDGHATDHEGDSSLLGDGDEGDLTGSTPRPPATRTQVFSNLESPYERVKREMTGGSRAGSAAGSTARPGSAGVGDDGDEDEDTTILLQQHTARLPDLSMTPKGGSPEDARVHKTTAFESRLPTLQLNDLPAKDRLLHRVLDKTYRLQATPHKGAAGQRISPLRRGVTGAAEDDGAAAAGKATSWADSPMSSPIMAAPKLRSEVFMSPLRATGVPRGQLAAPRTPGVSVNTPATRKTRDVFQAEGTPADNKPGKKQKYEIDWESDSEEETGGLYGGMSPPKTIQFALPPSKLLQTPAREASKRIVEDILMTAGAEPEESDYSPTMVKMNEDILNESF